MSVLQGCPGAALARSGAQPSVLGCTYLVYRSGVPLRWDGRPSVPGCQISLARVPWCKATPGKGWVCPPGSLCMAFHPPPPSLRGSLCSLLSAAVSCEGESSSLQSVGICVS